MFSSVSLISSIFKIKKPPGITIGDVKFPLVVFFKIDFIFRFNELSLIQPKFPPSCDVLEMLCINAALSKLFEIMSFFIFFNFSFKFSFASTLKTISLNLNSVCFLLIRFFYIIFIYLYFIIIFFYY